MRPIEAVFIGASAGGITALQMLTREMDDFPLPVVVVQHLPPDAQIEPQLVFGSHTKLPVSEAEDKEQIADHHIYFAPPGYHLLIERDHSFSLSQDDPVQFARPSIDVLFESAAVVYGAGACGIILTGANADGAEGLNTIHSQGGYTMVQDPSSAEVSMMPASALARFQPDFVGNLRAIGQRLLLLYQEANA
jgi:two-component system chemotaxis response regulator CheB